MKETKIYFSYNNISEFNETIKMLDDYIKSYTLYREIGVYKGITETSIIIEIIHDSIELPKPNIRFIAKKIKEIANQDCVLITTKTVNMEFI